MKFRSRQELSNWLTDQAKEKLERDVVQLLEQGMDRDHVMHELAPAMARAAVRDRDEILANFDACMMDFNATAEHNTTIN